MLVLLHQQLKRYRPLNRPLKGLRTGFPRGYSTRRLQSVLTFAITTPLEELGASTLGITKRL